MSTYVELLTILVGFVFPILIDYFTKASLSDRIKALILPALSLGFGVVSAAIQAAQNNVAFDWKTAALAALVTWGTGIISHVGVWKPTLLSDKAQNSGVGANK